MALIPLLRRWLVLAHRYLGIAVGLLVVVWFASGILMIYSGGMPSIAPQERLDHLAGVDLSKIQFAPPEAAARAGFSSEWTGYGDGRVTLRSLLGRPAYRFGDEAVVFADTGEVLNKLNVDDSKQIASSYLQIPPEKLSFVSTLTNVDQWTIEMAGRLPLHKFAAENGAEIYVQPSSGEVAMLTTRGSRALAWVSAVPHWVFFTAFRTKYSLWYQFIIWTSGIACILAILGLILGVTQFRRTNPLRLASAIPYKGWMRWHYLTGAIFGIFTLTWAFSGLLSMEPFEWTSAEGVEISPDVFMGGYLKLDQFSNLKDQANQKVSSVCRQAAKEIEFVRIFGDPYLMVRCGAADASSADNPGQPERHVVSAQTFDEKIEPFSSDAMVARLADQAPGVPISDQETLTGYDSYYYSRERQAPLPILRVKFGDPAQTWLYVDPQMGRVVREVNRSGRLNRWLYTGLHDLDFSFWYDRRPLWDIAVITLLLGGLASSTIGLCLGIKRLFNFQRQSQRIKEKQAVL